MNKPKRSSDFESFETFVRARGRSLTSVRERNNEFRGVLVDSDLFYALFYSRYPISYYLVKKRRPDPDWQIEDWLESSSGRTIPQEVAHYALELFLGDIDSFVHFGRPVNEYWLELLSRSGEDRLAPDWVSQPGLWDARTRGLIYSKKEIEQGFFSFFLDRWEYRVLAVLDDDAETGIVRPDSTLH